MRARSGGERRGSSRGGRRERECCFGRFSFQNVLFVINKAKYEALGGPAFMGIINKVNSLLTAPAIQSMNKAVLFDKKEAADVAGQFLKANGLAGGSGS